MISVTIPGYGELNLQHIVLDYNGTMACDGVLIKEVEEKLNILAGDLKVHILTADTFGKAAAQCKGINGKLTILSNPIGGSEKENFVKKLGTDGVVAVGNGANDAFMLARAALGIAIIGPEGASGITIKSADIIVSRICDALDLLLNPQRLIATLRY
ncbi:MAG: ATPase P [Peptococcaceae bacterium BRH_c4b]|nr:MAG: ATPase P [Peptococcaceae bacterium BRH_c4b]